MNLPADRSHSSDTHLLTQVYPEIFNISRLLQPHGGIIPLHTKKPQSNAHLQKLRLSFNYYSSTRQGEIYLQVLFFFFFWSGSQNLALKPQDEAAMVRGSKSGTRRHRCSLRELSLRFSGKLLSNFRYLSREIQVKPTPAGLKKLPSALLTLSSGSRLQQLHEWEVKPQL